MADVQTLFRLLLINIKQDGSTSVTKTTDSIMRAICEALKYNRDKQVYFNEKTCTIALEDGQSKYSLPQDFIGLRSEVMWLSSTNSDLQIPLCNTTLDYFLSVRPSDHEIPTDDATVGDKGEVIGTTSWYTTNDSGNDYYAIDTEGKFIYVGKQSGFIRFKYTADLGTIQYKYDGSNWAYYIPNTLTTLTSASTYTNKWFTDGFDVLKLRAEYYLWSREYGGTEPAMAKAQIILGQYLDALSQLQKEGQQRNSILKIRRYIY